MSQCCQDQPPSGAQACCETSGSCDCPVGEAICDKNAPCPVETAIKMNTKSVSAAMQAVQVDILKEKIRDQWGPVMEKEADAILEAVGAVWRATLTQAKAKKALRETFGEILCEAEAG